MTQTVKVTRHYEIKYDGTYDQYVEAGDRISKALGLGGLDSLDGGDATGAFITAYGREAAATPDFDGTYIGRFSDSTGWDLLVTITAEDDLFVWDPPHS
jgi:hypothetical protein